MKTATEREMLTRISKEASLLSNYAWFAAVATDPQAQKDRIDNIISQLEYLKRAIAEALPEVMS